MVLSAAGPPCLARKEAAVRVLERHVLAMSAALLVLFVSACGGRSGEYAGSGPGPTPPPVDAPQITSVTFSPSLPVAELTEVTLRAQATIAAGAQALFEWDLGDGTTATGNEVRRVFLQAGEYTVRVTVTAVVGSTRSESRSESRIVPVAGLTGLWQGESTSLFGSRPALKLTQEGARLTGAYGELGISLDPPVVGVTVFRPSWTITSDRPGRVDADGTFEVPVGPAASAVLHGKLVGPREATYWISSPSQTSRLTKSDVP